MSDNGQRLSYRDMLNMSKGYSNMSKQQRLVEKYGPKPAYAYYNDRYENEKILIEKISESPSEQSKDNAESVIIQENKQLSGIPEKEVNGVKEFEKIFQRYLT